MSVHELTQEQNGYMINGSIFFAHCQDESMKSIIYQNLDTHFGPRCLTCHVLKMYAYERSFLNMTDWGQ